MKLTNNNSPHGKFNHVMKSVRDTNSEPGLPVVLYTTVMSSFNYEFALTCFNVSWVILNIKKDYF